MNKNYFNNRTLNIFIFMHMQGDSTLDKTRNIFVHYTIVMKLLETYSVKCDFINSNNSVNIYA